MDGIAQHRREPEAETPRAREAAPPSAPRRRVVSLDAFRGLTILGMIIVNNLALDTSTPRLLMHAPWNQGVTLADLVFPWFLLIVGVAIPFSLGRRQEPPRSWTQSARRIVSRAAALVLLGLLVDSSVARQPVLGLGVLQLIGLAYLVGALLYAAPGYARAATAVLFLAAHWAALRFLPVPGLGAGVLEEHANLVNYLNAVYLRPLHLQGLVSVAPTSALVLVGTLAGDLLRSDRLPPARKGLSLLLLGAVLAVGGWAWSFDLPLNKALWTSSYIIYTAGLGLLVLGVWYFLLDVKPWRWWAFPFVVFGSNAITAYVAPILFKVYILQTWTVPAGHGRMQTLQDAYLQHLVGALGRFSGGLVYTATYLLAWWLVLWYLHRKRLFLRV